MTIWGSSRTKGIRHALKGTHGLYAVVSIVKARTCFNTNKQLFRHSPLLFSSNGLGKADVVRAAAKDREAL